MLKSAAALGLFFSLVACSHTPSWESHRTPASLSDFNENADTWTLEFIRGIDIDLSENRTEIATAKVSQLVSKVLTYSSTGYKYLKDFDKDLLKAVEFKQEFNIGTNQNYQRLQTVKNMISQTENRAITAYAHLWDLATRQIEKTNTKEISVQSNAILTLTKLNDIFNELNSDARLLGFSRFKNSLEDVIESVVPVVGKTKHKKNKRELARLIQTIDELKRKEKELDRMPPDTFMSLVKPETVAPTQIDRAGERAPQAAFKNITGREFEANRWVLTFDDGPSSKHTREISDILTNYGIHGEFFWLSSLVPNQAKAVQYVYNAGHGINSHSFDHANLPKLGPNAINNQVTGSRDTINSVVSEVSGTNYRMKYFRCPYGSCVIPKSAKVQQAIADAGLTHVYWAVDTLDWQDRNTRSVLNRTLSQMKSAGRGVILFHDIHPVAENVLPLLLKSQYVQDNNVKWTRLP